MKYLGIDFGTVWTKAAVYDIITGKSVLVNMDDGIAANTDFELYGGQYACPTAVFFDKETNKYLVGKKAVRSRNNDPSNFHDKFKSLLSNKDSAKWEKDVLEIIKYVIKRAFITADCHGFSKIVLTVPSSTVCNDTRWQLMLAVTKKAYELAREEYGESDLIKSARETANKNSGLFGRIVSSLINGFCRGNISIIKEPESAAYSIINEKNYLKDGDRFLVYDFGGGTFDPALLQYVNGTLRVIGEWDSSIPRGKNIGGIYIDNKIRDDILEKDQLQDVPFFQEIEDVISSIPLDEYNRPVLKDKETIIKYRNAMRDLDTLSQLPIRAKHHFSKNGEVVFHEQKLGLYDYRLSIEEYNEITEPFVDDTIQCCDSLLSDYGWSWKDLKTVFLVGGSSAIPLVRDKMELKRQIEQATFDIPDINKYDHLYAVARGAALYESLKPTKEQRLEFGKKSLKNKEYDEAEFQFKEGEHFYWLGLMEYEGLGRKKSFRKAYEIFSEHPFNSLCDFMTALMLFKGEGVLKDDDEALRIIDRIKAETVNDTSPRRAQKIKDVINGTADEATIKEVYSTKFYNF